MVTKSMLTESCDLLQNSSSIKKALQQLDQGGSHAVEHVEQLIGE